MKIAFRWTLGWKSSTHLSTVTCLLQQHIMETRSLYIRIWFGDMLTSVEQQNSWERQCSHLYPFPFRNILLKTRCTFFHSHNVLAWIFRFYWNIVMNCYSLCVILGRDILQEVNALQSHMISCYLRLDMAHHQWFLIYLQPPSTYFFHAVIFSYLNKGLSLKDSWFHLQ